MMSIASQDKVILLKNFTRNTVLNYTKLHLLKEDIIRLEKVLCCVKCDTFNNIEVYEWVKKHTFIEPFPQNDLGDYLLIFNNSGTMYSCHKI